MEQKLINDQNAKFQAWAYAANQLFLRDTAHLELLYRGLTDRINQRIAEREKVVNSIIRGKSGLIVSIQHMFQKQRQSERRMRKLVREEEKKQALQLMDLNFAADVENMVMAAMGSD